MAGQTINTVRHMAVELKDEEYLNTAFYMEHTRWPALANTYISIPELVKCTAEFSLGITIIVAYYTWNLQGAIYAESEFVHFGRIAYEAGADGEEMMRNDPIYTLIIVIFLERVMYGFIAGANVVLCLSEEMTCLPMEESLHQFKEFAGAVMHSVFTCNNCSCFNCTVCEELGKCCTKQVCCPVFQRLAVAVPSTVFLFVLMAIIWLPDFLSFLAENMTFFRAMLLTMVATSATKAIYKAAFKYAAWVNRNEHRKVRETDRRQSGKGGGKRGGPGLYTENAFVVEEWFYLFGFSLYIYIDCVSVNDASQIDIGTEISGASVIIFLGLVCKCFRVLSYIRQFVCSSCDGDSTQPSVYERVFYVQQITQLTVVLTTAYLTSVFLDDYTKSVKAKCWEGGTEPGGGCLCNECFLQGWLFMQDATKVNTYPGHNAQCNAENVVTPGEYCKIRERIPLMLASYFIINGALSLGVEMSRFFVHGKHLHEEIPMLENDEAGTTEFESFQRVAEAAVAPSDPGNESDEEVSLDNGDWENFREVAASPSDPGNESVKGVSLDDGDWGNFREMASIQNNPHFS